MQALHRHSWSRQLDAAGDHEEEVDPTAPGAKPDPRTFELAYLRLGVPARAAVYVGDQLEVDALAATAVGLRGIWLNRNGGAVPSGVEAIDSLTDLPSLLEDLRLI